MKHRHLDAISVELEAAFETLKIERTEVLRLCALYEKSAIARDNAAARYEVLSKEYAAALERSRA